jgi:hypothetical protein
MVTWKVVGAPFITTRKIALYGSGKKITNEPNKTIARANVIRQELNTWLSFLLGIKTPSVIWMAVGTFFSISFLGTDTTCFAIEGRES